MASSRYANNTRRFGVIILGNSGVGKSFIANLFLASERFVHRSKPTAVTTVTEFEEYTLGDDTYVIFNIPGLIEAKQSQIDRNKQEIDKAFKECPNSVVIYVFGVNNGRVRNEDIIAFHALHGAYQFESDSLILVVNGMPPLNVRDEDYQGETLVLLRSYLNMKTYKNICFFDTIEKNNSEQKQQLREQILLAVENSSPKMHIKKQDIHLEIDEIADLTNKCREISESFIKERDQLQGQICSAQQQYQNEIQEQKKAFDLLKQNVQEQPKHKGKQSQDDGPGAHCPDGHYNEDKEKIQTSKTTC